jgi:hypothetical protein
MRIYGRSFALTLTEISNLLNRALDDYDNFIHEFHKLKAHVMALPATFQSSVHRYFANDIHFVAGAFSSEQQALVIPWAVSVLMNYPLGRYSLLALSTLTPLWVLINSNLTPLSSRLSRS